ncbi:MAG TPA: YceD family protein [Xylella taiwanensis]
MIENAPEWLDTWRMVAARRCFGGRIPLTKMQRLGGALLDTEGECAYVLEFGHDKELQIAYVALTVEAQLPLECQRSLQRFLLQVRVSQRMGLIRNEAEESALPPDYEVLLVPTNGILRPADLVEDELLLAIPLVPVALDTEAVETKWPPADQETNKTNPFAVLASFKRQ